MPEGTAVAEKKSDMAGFLSVIERAAINPAIDVGKMEKLLDMQERILSKNAEIAFNQAMTRLQPKLPAILQTSEIVHNGKQISTYAKYEDIDAVIRPLYSAEGFSLSFNTECTDKGAIIFGTLSHESGHSRTSSIPLPLDTSGAKNSIQAMGSTISYGKRYLVGMLLNIVTRGEDDDGEGANECIEPSQTAEIEKLMKEVGADKEKFLKFMGVNSIPTILAKDYNKALNALKAKGKK